MPDDDEEQKKRDKAFMDALAKDAREKNAAKIAAGAVPDKDNNSKGSPFRFVPGSKYKGRWRKKK